MKLLIGTLVIFLVAPACFWLNEKAELEAARELGRSGKIPAALTQYEKVQKKYSGKPEALLAAQEGARLAFVEAKDYTKAVLFYRYLLLYSADDKERMFSQRRLAEIYFERLSDFPKAIVELNKLLLLPHSASEEARFRMNLAKAYFYQNSFTEAETEAGILLEKVQDPSARFDALLMRGNIYFATKRLDEAIKTFKYLMETYPGRAREEQLGLTLAVCYEEKGEFQNAKNILSDLRPSYPKPDFLDLKIKRLQERESLQPGAGGFKK